MEVKLGTLVAAKETVALLNKKDCFPVSTAYKLMKNAKMIRSEVDDYNIQRERICKRYAKKDSNGKPILIEGDGRRLYSFSKENEKLVVKDLIDLQMQTINIGIHEICLSELGQAELSPDQLESIEFMLVVDGEEEE